MSDSPKTARPPSLNTEQPSLLSEGIVTQIERALRRVGDFGEVRLVVAKGRVRFIETTRSEPAGDDNAQGVSAG